MNRPTRQPASPKSTRADININATAEERAIVIRAAGILNYTRPNSTHGYSTYCRDVLLEHARAVIADHEKKSQSPTKKKAK